MPTSCNYQTRTPHTVLATVERRSACEFCGMTQDILIRRGETLEVCGDEFSSDPVTGDRVVVPIVLCPDCHAANHRDARGRHNPCQMAARRSREGLE